LPGTDAKMRRRIAPARSATAKPAARVIEATLRL
jgi:hypothetical protein